MCKCYVLERHDRSLLSHQHEQPPQHQVTLWKKKEMHQNLRELSITNNTTGFVVLSDVMAIIYSTYCTMWKWPKKLLHLAYQTTFMPL